MGSPHSCRHSTVCEIVMRKVWHFACELLLKHPRDFQLWLNWSNLPNRWPTVMSQWLRTCCACKPVAEQDVSLLCLLLLSLWFWNRSDACMWCQWAVSLLHLPCALLVSLVTTHLKWHCTYTNELYILPSSQLGLVYTLMNFCHDWTYNWIFCNNLHLWTKSPCMEIWHLENKWPCSKGLKLIQVGRGIF